MNPLDDKLTEILADDRMVDAIKQRIVIELNSQALKSLYLGEETTGYYFARKVIDGLTLRLHEANKMKRSVRTPYSGK